MRAKKSRSMLDHVCIAVADLEKSKTFYLKVLTPLGYGVVMEFGQGVGFGRDGKPSFWIGAGEPGPYWQKHHRVGLAPIHLAFMAADRSQVDAFHAAAMAEGAQDYGAPGVREVYHPNYYGAFVIDPDGNNIEAVCHLPA